MNRLFAVALVLWIMSVAFHAPTVVVFICFAAMMIIATAGLLRMPADEFRAWFWPFGQKAGSRRGQAPLYRFHLPLE